MDLVMKKGIYCHIRLAQLSAIAQSGYEKLTPLLRLQTLALLNIRALGQLFDILISYAGL
ncbi:hypothetical protein DPMN_006830 [Dreissena polymorpha]|uniref:Uncharacterized protein n=1 Tax=Dreissena polymorpha TaxID=45954 RepID=A0A9D4RVR1_DREPO|nr:hypothetical protein DPMN_006830 [Dreissena polymorpha]